MADNTQNTGSSKKKKIAASAIAVALAAALLIGGTFSYLQDDSNAILNTFATNENSVTLTETGVDENSETNEDGAYINDSFDIVPGISESKDPTVTVTYTLDSYVFLLVDDNTVYTIDGEEISYVDFDIDSAWELLYKEDNTDNPYYGQYAVYYRLVETSDDDDTTTYTESYSVISGDTVSYSSSLTNEDMEALTDNDYTVSLAFKALIIEAEPFTTAAQALAGYLGYYGTASEDYSSGTATTLSVMVASTIASTASAASTETTVTVTIPYDTTLTSSSDEITSLTLSVTEIYSADSTDILNDNSYAVGDYTYEISLTDQNGKAVSVSSDSSNSYIQIAIEAAAGVTNRKVYHDGEALSTSASSDGDAYYTYKSSTGVFTINTQSFSEYEICWRGTSSTTVSNTYTQGTYTSGSSASSKAVVSTTLANSASSSADEDYSSSTTFTVTVPAATTITSASDEITSLYAIVKDTTDYDTVAVVPGGDAGDYTFDISLIDQDAAKVTSASGYITITIAAKSGMENYTVTKLADTGDGTGTSLSTTKPSDGSDYYTYNSSTGALKIYTQSLGEYEIWWNDTELGISAVSERDLSFSLSSLGTTTYNHEVGWALDSSVYNISDSSGYYEYFIDYALTYNTDVSSLRFKGVTYDNSGGTVWVGNPYAKTGKSVTSEQTVLLMQDIFELSFGSEASNVDRLYTVKGIKAAYTTNYSKGFYFVSNHGTNATMVGTTSYSVEVELRLYEVADSEITGNYIVLDTLTLTYTYTE